MSIFAARYARALADVVLDAKLDPEQVESQLQDFAATFAASKELRELLLNPSMATRKRVAILDKVNSRIGCGPKVRNFIAVLISHERLGALPEVLEEYRLEMNRRLSISDAEVVTARAAARPGARTAGSTGRRAGREPGSAQPFAKTSQLIGGAIVRIGSTIYDGSVRGRLERLRERAVRRVSL